MLVYQGVTILKNDGVRQWVSDDIPYIYILWKIKFMFQTTKQIGSDENPLNPLELGVTFSNYPTNKNCQKNYEAELPLKPKGLNV
jgi:hypothetical protein